MRVQIIRCNCNHAYQDNRYGKKMRVMNLTKEKPGPIFRCTVCQSLKLGKDTKTS